MINKIDLRKAISSIAISNAKRNTIYRAFSDLDSITKEEFDSVKSDISKVVESMLTKDTVGKANGVASLDSNGSVPIEQLGNIDTTLFLIVRELPTTDIKPNKIYLVPNQDGQDNNVYIEYLYVENVWEKVGEFKPEVDLSHIEAKLNTKADLDKEGYVKVEQLTPAVTYDKDNNNINAMFQYVTLDKLDDIVKNDNPANGWQYYCFADMLDDNVVPQYIYDATADEHIEITATTYLDDINDGNGGDAFNTAKPLDLTHDLYLDNERIGHIGIFKGNNAIVKNSIIIGKGNATSKYNNKINNCIISEIASYTIKDIAIKNSIVFSAGTDTSINTFTDNVILSTQGERISKGECVLIGHCANSANISSGSVLIGQLGNTQENDCISIGYLCQNKNGIVIGRKSYTGEYSISIGNSNNIGSYPHHSISIGGNIYVANQCVAIGSDIESRYNNAIVIGYASKSSGHYSISIGSSIDNKAGNTVIKIGKFANPSATNDYGYYYIGGYKDDNTYYNIEETLTYNNQHKKYIYGIGGYDGTNSDTEGIKSLQQVLADKANASAIPTKVSQLTNDANFITSYTETDPVWTREKTNYYTKTEIDGKGYLTVHQSLDNCVKIGNDSTPAQLFKGQGTATINNKQIHLESQSGAVNITPEDFTLSGLGVNMFKVDKSKGIQFASDKNNVIRINKNEGIYMSNVSGITIGNPNNVAYKLGGGYLDLNDMFTFKSKIENTFIAALLNNTAPINNITDASTPEEVVTKFNQLLKSLKAIGLMKPDTTAE